MKPFFEELIQYNQVMNARMIDTILAHRLQLDERTLKLMSHILLVQLSWNQRMLGQEGLSQFWEMTDVEQMHALNTAYNAVSAGIIRQYGLDESYTYHNSKGAAYRNTYGDTLFHIINHSNYHRAQINTRLREQGVEPVVTDYIFYKR